MKNPNPRLRQPRRLPRVLQATPVAAACAAALWWAPGMALAQTVAVPGSTTQTVTVTGIRRGIESAIATKQNADQIVESISAEDIGKLPDTSIAESLARLPGVAAQRTDGRAQQISVRGLAPDFATGLLNGREQVSTGDSRGVEFDQFPGELVGRVDLYKAPDAGLVGQGLSGTFNIQTVRPLDFGERAVAVNYRRARLGAGLETDAGKGERFSISYIDQFADRTIGVAIGFARLDESSAQTQRFEAWGVADSAFGAGTVRTPGGFNAWVDQEERKRDGVAATLQYRPSREFQTSVDVFRSKFERDRSSKGFQAPIGFSSAGGYDPEGTLTSATVAGGVATSGTFNNFKGVVRNDTEANEDRLTSVGWNTQARFGDWTGTLDLSQSKVRGRGGILETTAGRPGPDSAVGVQDTISWTGFDGNNLAGATYTTGINYADRSAVALTDVMGWGGGAALPQAGYSKLPQLDDKINQARLSGKLDLQGAPAGFVAADFGLNVTDRSKTRAYIEGRLVIPGSPFATAAVPGDATIVAGQSGIEIVSWSPFGSIGNIYDVAAKRERDIANKDWTVDEKVTTLYTKWDLDTEWGGTRVFGNLGLQYVRSDQSSRAFNIDGRPCPGDVCPVTDVVDGIKYNDVLPSANLNFDIGGGQVIRVAAARVMARPNMNDMRASLGFGVNNTADGGPRLEGGAGNPRLKPFRANALDVSYEKYWGNRAYVSLAGFNKSLNTYIVRANREFDFAPFVNAETPLPVGGSTIGLLNQPINGSGGSIRGVELAASMPFELLTTWLTGFGVQASYSNTRSNISLPTEGFAVNDVQTGSIPLPGLSRQVSNLTLYYERFGFSARVGQRSRSNFVGEISDFTGDRQLTYIKGEKVVDAQVGYEFQSGPVRGLSLLFQVNNLNNAEFVRYRDTPSNEIERVKYGRTYLLGLNYRL
jgi:iron complex outermembrane recepter protein